jgi:hypothetical protein
MASKKAQREKLNKMVEDKTFGLKNKKKSKQVRQTQWFSVLVLRNENLIVL